MTSWKVTLLLLSAYCIPSKPGMERACVCGHPGFYPGQHKACPAAREPLRLITFHSDVPHSGSSFHLQPVLPGALQEAPNLPLPHSGLFCVLWRRHRENLLPFCPLAAIHLSRCTPESLKTTQITVIWAPAELGLVPPRCCQEAPWEGFQLLPLQLSRTKARGFPAFLKISLLMEIFGLIN